MQGDQVQPTDIRGEERQASGLAGRIVLASLVEARDVILRDISRCGAKLHIGDWPELPRSFYLMLRTAASAEPVRIECDRRWQVGATIGVRFTAPLPDDLFAGLLPPEQPAAA